MKNEVELEALVWHPYGTGFREVGERYTATQEDAEVLVSLGRARLAKKAKDDTTTAAATKPASKPATKGATKSKR